MSDRDTDAERRVGALALRLTVCLAAAAVAMLAALAGLLSLVVLGPRVSLDMLAGVGGGNLRAPVALVGVGAFAAFLAIALGAARRVRLGEMREGANLSVPPSRKVRRRRRATILLITGAAFLALVVALRSGRTPARELSVIHPPTQAGLGQERG